MSTEVDKFFQDLDGGQFEAKLSKVLSDVAGAVIDHQKGGEINLKFTIKQIGNSAQVHIDHELKYKRPTKRGALGENELTSTPMYVGRMGALSFFPENQAQMFDKKGGPAKTPFPEDEKREE